MKRYFYESKIARLLLCLSTCTTIALGPLVFCKKSEDAVLQSVKNHETTHAIQWTEVTILSGFVIFLLQVGLGFSGWWYLLVPVVYYIWYVLEWLVKFAILQDWNSAYRSVCFELEAYDSQHDNNYIENRDIITPWMGRLLDTVIG